MSSVPTSITPAALLPRVPYHDSSLPLVLLWSEKSGCTSLLKWFLHHIGRLEEATAHSDWIHDWEYDVLKADPGYDQRVAQALNDGIPAVKLVRDPFDRAVSSYLMMCVLGDDSGHFTVELRRQLREYLYGDPDVPYGFGFIDMLRWMTTLDLATLNGHLGPQSTTLEEHLADLEIVRLDEFDARFRDIEGRLGLEPADLRSVTNSTHHTVRAELRPTRPGAVSRLQLPIPHDGWPLPPAAAFVDDESVRLVESLFAEDYARYGFESRTRRRPTAAGTQAVPNEQAGAAADGAERYRIPVYPTDTNDPHSLAIQLIGGGRRVLELGCAAGYVTEHLAAAGNELVGVEFDAEAAAEAAEVATRVHVLDLDVDRVSDVEHDRFDVVYAGDVLEHLRDPVAALDDALTLLDPGGDVVLSIPNAAHGDVRLHLLEGRIEYADTGLLDRTHLRWFTRASLRSMLDDTGLVAVELRRVVRPLGATNVPFDADLHSSATAAFVRSDPDHDTVQFVVRCRRRSEVPEGFDPTTDDALAPIPHEWVRHSTEDVEELSRYAADLRTALDAWERSRLARLQRWREQLTASVRRTLRR